MATFTVRHAWSHELAATHSGLMRAWRRFQQGREWASFRSRYTVELVRSVEVTHGPNGWHPHLHCLVLTREPLPVDADDTRVKGSAAWMFERWADCVDIELGPEHAPSPEHGTDLRDAHKADYLSKLCLEVTDAAAAKQGRKGHRTPWQILQDAQSGDVESARLWQVFAAAMVGRRFHAFTRGLGGLRAAARFQNDLEDAAEMERATVIDVLTPREWDLCRDVPGFRARYLAACESGERRDMLAVLCATKIEALRARALAQKEGSEWSKNLM